MIYWPTTPGAGYVIAVPNHYGLTQGDVDGKQLQFHIRNNVGRWEIGSGGFVLDGVSPDWLMLYLSNDDPLPEGDLPPDGEYTYEAVLVTPDPDTGEAVEEKVLSVGIMQFGEYTAERRQYEKPIVYEQYDRN